MEITEYIQFDAMGLAELVRQKEVTPERLMDIAISLTNSYNPKLGAIVQTCHDAACDAIKQGLPQGPFTGVPFLLKDLGISLAGTRTTNGARFSQEAPIVNYDSELVKRYKQAGLVIFGKTNVPEYGLSFVTESLAHGPCRNPWNLNLTAGGSSGGAASSVASRIVPAAHASDGGGSIRVPAACTGLFGLKPTRARTPVGPDMGEMWGGLGVNHVLTRSVRDSAAMLDISCMPEAGAPYVAPTCADSYLEAIKIPPAPLKMAFSGQALMPLPIAGECIDAVNKAIKLCDEMGHHVEENIFQIDIESLGTAFQTIASSQILASIQSECLWRDIGWPNNLEPFTNIYCDMAENTNASAYVRAVRTMQYQSRIIGEFFQEYDILITPALAQLPVAIGELGPETASNFNSYILKQVSFSPFTSVFNQTGQPAMSVPMHWSESGLPVGVQFVGRFGDEMTLLKLAAQLESSIKWDKKIPKID